MPLLKDHAYLTARPFDVRHRDGENRSTYCGPAAIASITGTTAESAIEYVNAVLHRPMNTQVRGVDHLTLKYALRRLGFSLEKIGDFRHSPASERPTFTQWTKARTAEDRSIVHLVIAGNHYLVVHRNHVWDSWERAGVRITERRSFKRARVEQTFRVQIMAGVRRGVDRRFDPAEQRRERARSIIDEAIARIAKLGFEATVTSAGVRIRKKREAA